MSNKIILNIENLEKYFNKLYVLKKLSLKIPKQSIYGILGPNGSGKSTLMRIIAGLIKSWDGAIYYKEKKLDYNNPKVLKNFGFMIESPTFYEYLSAVENLKILSNLTGTSIRTIYKVLELVNLKNRMHEKVKTFSYGMKQRLGIAQTLLHKPEILILDEPSNGLDPRGIKDMESIINRLQNEGKTILISTHILSEVENLCTDVSILKKGALVASLNMNTIQEKNNKYIIKSKEILKVKNIFEKQEYLNILKITDNSIVITSDKNLNFESIIKILNNKVLVEAIDKQSNLIDFFYD